MKNLINKILKTNYPIKGYMLHYKPNKNDIVLDIGAYPGDFTKYISKYVKTVICFEPDKKNYDILKQNIKNLTNVITINKALWSDTVIKQFNSINDYDSGFILEEHWKKNIGRKGYPKNIINVKTSTIDIELKNNSIKNVNFIKMDVQGAEINIIKGATKTLKTNDLNIAIASYHIVNGVKTCYELEKIFNQFGYNTFTSFPKHLTTYANKK